MMETNAKHIESPIPGSPNPNLKIKELFKNELFLQFSFAIASGILIFLGWIFSKFGYDHTAIVLFITSYLIGGFYKAKEGILDTIENKSLNVEILMILAAIGAAMIGYWEEGAILIFIFAMSGALETYTTNKSHKELTALMNLAPEEAWLIENGQERRVPVEQLKVGDRILIKPGEQVPADGIIHVGKTSIDESAITGEAIPVYKSIKDEVFAGTVNGSGSITVEITKPNHETLFQKIVTLVKDAQSDKSPSQQFLDRFEATYVYVVLAATGLMMFLPHYLLNWSWEVTFYRAIVLLVVASPCAVVASITPATLSAISNGARNGILFKGGVHLENLGNLKAIALDKTGTLTKGRPEVTDCIIADEFKDEEETILQVVASIENQSNHPLAQAIVRYVHHDLKIDLIKPEYVEDVSGWGIQGKVAGSLWKIGKSEFMKNAKNFLEEKLITDLALDGKTVVHIQKENQVVGVIALKDIVRPESKQAIEDLHKLDVHPIMLTGDNHHTAEKIAEDIGIRDFIAECLPNEKVEMVKKIKEKYGITAMVGDGINDAPALATANVGIAMGEGTDVALETADVVLMKNELSKISKAVQLSKKMNRIIKQNLFFSVAVIVMLIISNFVTGIDLPFAVIGHEGSTILVILNGLRLLRNGNM